MRENRDEIIIQATPEEVWDILTDLGKHGEWNPLIHRATGKIELGGKVRLSAKSGSIDMNYNCSVVKAEPYRELQWKWHIVFPFLFRGDHTFTIEHADDKSIKFNLQRHPGAIFRQNAGNRRQRQHDGNG